MVPAIDGWNQNIKKWPWLVMMKKSDMGSYKGNMKMRWQASKENKKRARQGMKSCGWRKKARTQESKG